MVTLPADTLSTKLCWPHIRAGAAAGGLIAGGPAPAEVAEAGAGAAVAVARAVGKWTAAGERPGVAAQEGLRRAAVRPCA